MEKRLRPMPLNVLPAASFLRDVPEIPAGLESFFMERVKRAEQRGSASGRKRKRPPRRTHSKKNGTFFKRP
jgi:hypothetical protein